MIVLCSIYSVSVFWFNIQPAKKSYRWQFFISMQNVTSFALWCFFMDRVQQSQGCRAMTRRQFTFLNLGAQISCSQNWYTNLKSALDQPLFKVPCFSPVNQLLYALLTSQRNCQYFNYCQFPTDQKVI